MLQNAKIKVQDISIYRTGVHDIIFAIMTQYFSIGQSSDTKLQTQIMT